MMEYRLMESATPKNGEAFAARLTQNLLRAQQTAAILTTFNEVDLTKVMELRSKHKERFEKQSSNLPRQ